MVDHTPARSFVEWLNRFWPALALMVVGAISVAPDVSPSHSLFADVAADSRVIGSQHFGGHRLTVASSAVYSGHMWCTLCSQMICEDQELVVPSFSPQPIAFPKSCFLSAQRIAAQLPAARAPPAFTPFVYTLFAPRAPPSAV
jgi:hypothetical protein